MDANKVVYVFYRTSPTPLNQENRLIIYYSKETMDPVIAVKLTPAMRPPEGFKMLDYVTVTKNWLTAKCKELDSIGILIPYGRTLTQVSTPSAS